MTAAKSLVLTPAHHAGRILAAWAAGDEPWLQRELQNSQKLDCGSGKSLDQERLELLQAVSQGMMRLPARGAGDRHDPAVRSCLDLLTHLAKAPGVAPASN